MKTKLTLSVDKDIIDSAKNEAGRTGQSLSNMFTDFIKTKSNMNVNTIRTKDIVGSLKGFKLDDSKEAIRSAYARKYLHRS
ncbi:MAG TPA: DUF6364 family protein [Candidatus Saccharimonadales bacterium]|jgi:hypothetical protein